MYLHARLNKTFFSAAKSNHQRSDKGKEKEKSEFRINARNLFLTYPKCDLEPEEALSLLRPELDFEDYVIAQEMHEDGTPHLHCWLQARPKKKFNIRDPAKLDLLHHHGNYQAARSQAAVLKYVTKDGKWISNLPEEEVLRLKSPSKSKTTKVPTIVMTPPPAGPSNPNTVTTSITIAASTPEATFCSLLFEWMPVYYHSDLL